HLLRGEDAVPVLVIGTYRDTDLGRGHPLAELLADLRRQPHVERVDLRGLPADGVAELIGAAAGQDLDAEIASLAEEVWGETEGNPFFVGQILRHLVETGAVVQEDGRWVRRAGELGLPEGVREVIGHRLSRLDDATNEVLALAAVLGREFDAETLVAASDGHAELVFDALEQAEQARLVTGTRGRPGRYSFVHALVRSTLYEELATTRRLRLHKRVGEVLEARHPERHADELAHHWCEAAVLDGQVRAVSYARQAAARALERLAYEEAVGWYERVLGVLDPDDGDHALRAELLIELGYALWFAGEHRWLAPMAEAMDEARAAGDGELFARAAIGRGGRRPWVEVGVVDDDLLAGLYEALDRLPPGDSPLRAMAMARIAGALYFRATSHDERIELSHASLAMASRCDDPEALAFVLICFHWGIWQPGNAAERLDVAQELLGLARRLGNRDMEAIALQYETGDRWELGDVAGARGGLQRLMAVNEQLGTPEGRWITSLAQGALSLFEGDVASVRRHMAEQTKWWGRVAPGNAQQLYGIQDLAVRHLCGGMEELLPLCEAMIETYPNVPAWRTAVVFIGWAIGDLERARRELDVLGADGFRLPLDGNWHVGVALCGLAAHAVGDVGAGERLYELLAPHSGAWVCVGMISDCLGPGHLYTGLAAGAAGRAEVAEHHLRVALELVEAAGSPRLALVVKTAWAQQAARVGDRRRAEELVAQVVRECHERGYDGLRAQAERVLAR
ncbi:MAG: hypothetical protein Q8K58_09655, partial [Acidimicrobiales bacterium]|nr:hypothetical protein [Acidimicrobiales bacterium]